MKSYCFEITSTHSEKLHVKLIYEYELYTLPHRKVSAAKDQLFDFPKLKVFNEETANDYYQIHPAKNIAEEV